MKYFIFLTLFFIFPTSHAGMVNLVEDRTLDSTKLEVKANCNFMKEVNIFYDGKKIVNLGYDGDSCQIHFDTFKKLLKTAQDSHKKIYVNTNQFGNTSIEISKIDNDPINNKMNTKILTQKNSKNESAK